MKRPKPRPFVVIVRGLPGVGKTSTGLVLREKLAPAAAISIDTLRSFVTPRLFLPDHLRVAKLSAARMATGYAEVGISSIIDSVFEDARVLDEMRSILEEACLAAHVFTLRASLSLTLDRNLARDRHYHQPRERIEELFATYKWSIGHEIDTSDKLIEQTADLVIDRLHDAEVLDDD